MVNLSMNCQGVGILFSKIVQKTNPLYLKSVMTNIGKKRMSIYFRQNSSRSGSVGAGRLRLENFPRSFAWTCSALSIMNVSNFKVLAQIL